jgi:3-hydroxyacyl-[acyl-carrier-protein] dehydratase
VFNALDRPPRAEATPQGTRVTVRLPVNQATPQMAGHYPGFPILPGVLLIDCVRQAAGFAHGAELRLRSIDRARFARPLLPGDELELSLLVTPQPSGQVTAQARGVRADGQMAAELHVTLEPAVANANA